MQYTKFLKNFVHCSRVTIIAKHKHSLCILYCEMYFVMCFAHYNEDVDSLSQPLRCNILQLGLLQMCIVQDAGQIVYALLYKYLGSSNCQTLCKFEKEFV